VGKIMFRRKIEILAKGKNKKGKPEEETHGPVVRQEWRKA
jgi:hypothetical protein